MKRDKIYSNSSLNIIRLVGSTKMWFSARWLQKPWYCDSGTWEGSWTFQWKIFGCSWTNLSARGWRGKIPLFKILQLWISSHALWLSSWISFWIAGFLWHHWYCIGLGEGWRGDHHWKTRFTKISLDIKPNSDFKHALCLNNSLNKTIKWKSKQVLPPPQTLSSLPSEEAVQKYQQVLP